MRAGIVALCICAISFSALGIGSDECGCPAQPQATNGSSDFEGDGRDEPVLMVEVNASQTSMEWQCMVVEYIFECRDWDAVPCYGCMTPCEIACAGICQAGLCWVGGANICKIAFIPCTAGCGAICRNYVCPSCRECVSWKVTAVKTCGWVFTE